MGESKKSFEETLQELTEKTKMLADKAEAFFIATGEKITSSESMSKVGELVDKAGEYIDKATDYVEHKIDDSNIGDKIRNLADKVEEKAENIIDSFKKKKDSKDSMIQKFNDSTIQ